MLSFQWGKCQEVGSANFSEDISLPWQKATETGFGHYAENWEAKTHLSEPRWSLLSSIELRVCVYTHTHASWNSFLQNAQELHTIEWGCVY